MSEHQSQDLAEWQREGPVLSNDLLPTGQGSIRCLAHGTSFGLGDLEALMNVVFEAKEWITAHTLKR